MSNTASNSNLGNLLNKPHFPIGGGSGGGDGSLPPDPAIPTRIVATLDHLVAYVDNPRQTRNPLYDEIKESIRNRGLDHAPNVTRKTPADPYMIKDGGNTRLQILRELWEETGDHKYYRLELMFHPWTSDLDVLVGHMIENEMRGNMMFIERAIAARRIKEKLEAEKGKSISVKALAARITEMGWSMNDSNLGQMLYAEELLFPVIPEAFWHGIGIDRVKKIRKLLDTCRTYWEAAATSEDYLVEESSFEDVWKPVFTKLDGDGFDVEAAEYQLCGAMAKRLNGPVLSVTSQVQAIATGIKDLTLTRPSYYAPEPNLPPVKLPEPPRPASHIPQQPSVSPHLGTEQSTPEAARTKPANDYSAAPVPTFATSPTSLTLDEQLGYRKYGLSEIPGGTPILYKDYTVHNTKYLQERARDAAISYGKRFGVAQYVIDLCDRGGRHIGYAMDNAGLESLSLGRRVHWALLSSYALLRHEQRDIAFLEGASMMFQGEINIVDAVGLLLSALNARTVALGECARGDNDFIVPIWHELTEIEAVAAVLATRTWAESQEMDEIPDEVFKGVERETGAQ